MNHPIANLQVRDATVPDPGSAGGAIESLLCLSVPYLRLVTARHGAGAATVPNGTKNGEEKVVMS